MATPPASDPRVILRSGLPDQYLTPDDIATMLKVPKETVYQWRKKHTGPPSFRIGKHVRYDPAVVHAYIAQRMADDRTAA
jgi:excisionase family DNA binding protein